MTSANAESTSLNGNDLLRDFLDGVAQQRRQDGTYRTPLGSDEQRRRILTEHWRGTRIAARVLDGDKAHIIREGERDEAGEDYIYHDSAEGRIETIALAYGGWIKLEDGISVGINMPAENQGPLRTDFEPGIEIEILS